MPMLLMANSATTAANFEISNTNHDDAATTDATPEMLREPLATWELILPVDAATADDTSHTGN